MCHLSNCSHRKYKGVPLPMWILDGNLQSHTSWTKALVFVPHLCPSRRSHVFIVWISKNGLNAQLKCCLARFFLSRDGVMFCYKSLVFRAFLPEVRQLFQLLVYARAVFKGSGQPIKLWAERRYVYKNFAVLYRSPLKSTHIPVILVICANLLIDGRNEC